MRPLTADENMIHSWPDFSKHSSKPCRRSAALLKVGYMVLIASARCSSVPGCGGGGGEEDVAKKAEADSAKQSEEADRPSWMAPKDLLTDETHDKLEAIQQAKRLKERYAAKLPTRSKFTADFSNIQYPNVRLDANQLDEAWVQAGLRGISHFQKLHKLPAEKSKAIGQLFERIIRISVSGGRNDELQAMFDELLELVKSNELRNDPYYNLIRFLLIFEMEEHFSIKEQGPDCVRLFEKSDYPAYFVVWMAVKIYQSGRATPDKWRQPNHISLDMLKPMQYWLTKDFRLEPKDHRVAWRMIRYYLRSIDFSGIDHADRTLKPLVNDLEIAPWIRTMIQAEFLTRKAWDTRGGGYGGDIDPTVWQAFMKQEKKAVDYFKQALEINPNAPEPAAEITRLARTSAVNESMDEWFERTTEIQFDYMPVYEHMLVFNLFPRWGGSSLKLIEFGRECYESGRFDTRVPFVLLQAYAYVRTVTNDRFMEEVEKMMASEELALDLRDCMRLMVKKNRSTSVSRDLDLSFLVFAERLAGDYESSRKAADKLEGHVDPELFKMMMINQSPAFWTAHSYAGSGQFVTEAAAVQELVSSTEPRRMPRAIEIAEEVIASNPPAQALPHFRGFLDMARDLDDFWKHKTVEFKFDPQFTSWFPYHPRRVRYVDEHSVKVQNYAGPNHTLLTHLAILPGPKTIEVEIEPIEYRDQLPEHNSWGFTIGQMLDSKFYVTYSAAENKIYFGNDTTGFVLYYEVNRIRKFPVKLRADVYGGYFEVYLNDDFIFRSAPDSFVPYHRTSLIHPDQQGGAGQVQFSNFNITRINDGVPPHFRHHDAYEKFYSQRIARDDSDPHSYYWRGLGLHAQKEYEACINDMKDAIENGRDIGAPAFFIGDCWERLGKPEKAISWYKKSAESKGITKKLPIQLEFEIPKITDNYIDHARFRLAWLQIGRPDLVGSTKIDLDGLRVVGTINPDWAARRLDAQILANDLDFDGAIELIEDVSEVPAKVASDVAKQISAYKKKQVYRIDADSQFHIEIMRKDYFPYFDSLLRERWKAVYH